ncbi:hypothetical protein HYDPIDRAFT_140554 [Hydnomerulius pinastri MD-312]|uniref:Transcription factor CBF/NF-Y/archaeal histone domain-containing protein n=1 Tax=Hydnomerulius pinastri MD-312 TaxID=994086 RepID=A0A0C9W9C8_9AGAM|nr:hypothetical protein HYDPIDRAFT_140554 [Hydnomerulius pinastri MD-312]
MAEDSTSFADEAEGSKGHSTPALQLEVQATLGVDEETEQAEGEEQTTKKQKSKREPPVQREREPGKSILPFSRVQKIIKADKDLPIVAKDATFLISLATEEFIKRLSEACQKLAEREKRTTVQQKDIASIVRRADEFLFLEEIISFQRTEIPAKRKPQAHRDEENGEESQPTLLDKFVQRSKAGDEAEDSQETPGEVMMNEDGAMYAG